MCLTGLVLMKNVKLNQHIIMWEITKTGLSVIKKTKKEEWTNRLNSLSSQITYWIQPENTTNKTIEIIELFYGNS
jgi:hypothetical protein